jgi:hypothetical protein
MSGVGTAPRSKRMLERESTGFKWCGPDDCGYPDHPCRWGLCNDGGDPVGCQPERHAHQTADMIHAASSTAPAIGSPQPKKKPKPRGAYVPRKPDEDDD